MPPVLVAAMLCPILLILFFVVLIVGIIVLAFIWRFWADKKLKEYCERSGFIFYGKNIPHAWNMMKGSALDRGHSQKMFYGIGSVAVGEGNLGAGSLYLKYALLLSAGFPIGPRCARRSLFRGEEARSRNRCFREGPGILAIVAYGSTSESSRPRHARSYRRCKGSA